MATPFSQTTRALSQDRSPGGIAFWLLALAVLGAWLWWFLAVPVTVYEVSQSARIEVARAAHPLASPIAGKIMTSHLYLEKPVNVGDVLVELDATPERLKLEEEEARLKAIPPQLEALQRQIADEEQAANRLQSAADNAVSEARWRHKAAEAAARFNHDQSARLQELRATGGIAEIDALKARAEADKSQSAADALSFEITRLGSDASGRSHEKRAAVESLRREVARLEGQAQQSRAAIERLREEIDRHLIRAPVEGKVGEITPLATGAFVAVGDVVGRIVPAGDLRVVADFAPARVLGRVHPAQTGRMRLDGFPWTQYGSVGVKVDRVASEVRDGAIRVELLPLSRADSDLLLQHGLPGVVEIDIEQVTPATLALRAAGQSLTRPVRSDRLQAMADP